MKLPRGAKEVPGWPGYYITRDGRVFSTRGRWKAVVHELKPRIDHGYLAVNLSGARNTRVHRLLLMTFVGPPLTPKHEGRHLNDVRTDNRISNLAWGTHAENLADAVRNGRTARGERNRAKLTESQVRQIHALRVSGLTARAIADRFGVSPYTVYDICSGRKWKCLDLGPAARRVDAPSV